MKPKKIICPICGEEMTPSSWGMERGIAKYCGARIPCDMVNYVYYECSCGCSITYKGSKDCWKKECRCKCCKRTMSIKECNARDGICRNCWAYAEGDTDEQYMRQKNIIW